MNFKKTSAYIGLIAGSVLAISSAPAQAASFSASEAGACVGQTSCTVNDFFTLTATKTDVANPQITTKTEGGITGLGIAKDATNLNFRDEVNGDPSGGEIDKDEVLSIAFKEITQVTAIDLSFLYQPGVFADQVFEVALVTPFASALQGVLRVTGDATASWTFNGVTSAAVNLSPSVEGGGGAYSILDPFGALKIAGFTLTPLDNQPANTKPFHGSDFSLLRVATVPEPTTTAAVFGLAAIASSFGLRRRNKSAA